MNEIKAKSTIAITIDDIIDDIPGAGEAAIRAAIVAAADRTDWCASGEIGPTFDAGSTHCRHYDAIDYARRALDPDHGAGAYIDAADGRMATGLDDDDTPTWTDASVVRIECPTAEEALERPAVAAAMARAVIDHHGPASDRRAWADLIRAIRDAAEAIEGIDPDDIAVTA